MTAATAAPAPAPPRREWTELVATILLAVAAVMTAWSSYQASRWNGEQAKSAGKANGLRIQAARSASLGQSQSQIDVATFIEWVSAHQAGNVPLETFYVER